MRKIIKVKVRKMKSKDGKDYLLSTATLDDGSEATGVGEFKEGEIVRSWFDEKYNKIKIAHLIQAGNIAIALLCLIGLIVLIIGSIILVQIVQETYAEGQLRTTGTVFKQEILPAPPTRKATVIEVQPTAVKEVLQNTARP